MAERLLVVGAHPGDFVWRAAGAIAVTTKAGGAARVVALSYGERGESGELWEQAGQTVERVKTLRHREAEAAAAVLGADFRGLDFGDYPLEVGPDRLERLVDEIRDFAPDVLITHTSADPYNPDHALAHAAVLRARSLAAGVGVPSAFATVTPPVPLAFEPHLPESCGFAPTTFLDISAVMPLKRQAMAAMQAQAYLPDHYVARAEQRAHQARLAAGRGSELRYAEAFQSLIPTAVDAL